MHVFLMGGCKFFDDYEGIYFWDALHENLKSWSIKRENNNDDNNYNEWNRLWSTSMRT